MGRRMSGSDSWAMVAPSVNSTIECTIDCGCTTTSIWSKPSRRPASPAGAPNSSWASITSRPLFISVDESTVIFGPIDQVGWARASSTVTAASSAGGATPERPAAGGEHELGHPGRVVVGPQALVDGAVLAVDRHQLGARRAARPLHHRARRRSATPCWPAPGGGRPRSVARVTDSPAKPDHPVDHDVGLGGQAGQRAVAGPDLALRAGRSASSAARSSSATATTLGRYVRACADQRLDRRPRRRARSARSGPARPRTTSSVWVPIEPVDPAIATRHPGMTSAYRRPRPGTRRASWAMAAGPAPRPTRRRRVELRGRLAGSARRRRPDRAMVRPGAGPGSGSRRWAARTAAPSKRSSTPPWPGRRLPMSLMPEVALDHRLGQVAERRRPRRRPAPNSRAWPALKGPKPRSPGERSATPRTEATRPPTRPSTVLFGLTAVSGRRPNRRPTTKPPTS